MRVRLAPQAFPKTFRLLRRADFRRVYDEGQRRSAPLCTVFYKPNGLAETRLGITTPKAVGNAVARNRVRRRLREIFRRNRTSLARGWDVVLNPRSAVAEAPFEALEREVLRLFPRQSPPPIPPASATPPPSASEGQPKGR
ncbi:MAG TPA: ribonuclease P protein component [Terriglobia bacterium]|nr:ribonuclease P protein component [Terriglobia bacterium]